MAFPIVPYDAELKILLEQIPIQPLTKEGIPLSRGLLASQFTADSIISTRAITHEQRTIPGPAGDIIISIFRPKNRTVESGDPSPGVYYIHGGGMVVGNRYLGIRESACDFVEDLGAVLVSVEYRLAPENPFLTPVEDCYAGLKWVSENAKSLGIDPSKLMISGASAGGGLAAGTALLARDRGGPPICAQHLQYPMLDDRNVTVSSQQYARDNDSWSRGNNLVAWECLLGDRVGGDNVPIYTAPSRATNLSGLPQAFIEVGSAEVFRDECVAYASKLWAAGIQTELHVWPGACHGADIFFPQAVISRAARAARNAWVGRVFSSLSS
jgi:acetyl esterase/lipase